MSRLVFDRRLAAYLVTQGVSLLSVQRGTTGWHLYTFADDQGRASDLINRWDSGQASCEAHELFKAFAYVRRLQPTP